MKQLPGRIRPRWQQQLASSFVLGLGLVLMVALLPIFLPLMLIAGLLASLGLIPVLRQLRREIEQLDQVQQKSNERIPLDVTPWPQKVWARWKASANKRS